MIGMTEEMKRQVSARSDTWEQRGAYQAVVDDTVTAGIAGALGTIMSVADRVAKEASLQDCVDWVGPFFCAG